MKSLPATVYLCFDIDGRLIYVGMTGTGRSRLGAHAHGSPWWQHTAHIQLRHTATRQEAFDLEERLIAEMNPLFNRRVKRNGKWVRVTPAEYK